MFVKRQRLLASFVAAGSSIDPTSRVVAAAVVGVMSADHVVSHVVLQVHSVVGTMGA